MILNALEVQTGTDTIKVAHKAMAHVPLEPFSLMGPDCLSSDLQIFFLDSFIVFIEFKLCSDCFCSLNKREKGMLILSYPCK